MKRIATNKKARYEYAVVEKIEAGIALMGTEVKSLREGKVTITDTYALVEGDQLILRGLHISPYSHTSQQDIEPRRDRKLLLHKKEIRRMIGKIREKGLTLVPLCLYFNERGLVKVELALARGKKTYDKRRAIKDRDMARDLGRELKDKR
ncbi:MAG: SsrA-binding protein SmpB [bacterium]|nr:SsrA-binding protein SmpB [bacterium]